MKRFFQGRRYKWLYFPTEILIFCQPPCTRRPYLASGKCAPCGPVLLTTSAPLTCSRACGQYLIRAIEPKQFSEWVVCSELDTTCTVKTVCRLAQLVLKSSSASAGKCSPEEACHQSSLSLQARLEPSTYLAEGERRSGMTVAGQFHMSRDCIGLDGVATAVGLFSTFVRM